MSIFNKHIDDSPITAFQIASLKSSDEQFGQYGGWGFLKPLKPSKDLIDLDKITPKDIDEVLSNILSYIYYFARLGICNTNFNKNQVSIPTGIFGIYQYNYSKYEWIINYVTEYLEKLGFGVTYCYNDDKLTIDWIEKYCEIHNI